VVATSARDAGCGLGGVWPLLSGNGIRTTSGVPICPASQGNDDLKFLGAKGQSCLPGVATTAQSIPLARPNEHSVLAA